VKAVRRGHLHDAASAPAAGEERFLELLAHRNLVVEQILSGVSERPSEYLQDQDEWVLVLAGGASMTVDGEPVELGPGDWVFLPGGVPHSVERTQEGTSWLAVHLHPAT
jgi:cupin 2 domain-containing protein